MNRATRAASVLCLIAAIVLACARPRTASAPLSPECMRPGSRIVDADSIDFADGHSVVGRVVTMEGRKPVAETGVALLGDSLRAMYTDSTGEFHFDAVPSGRYRLLGRRIGYLSAAESITVPARRHVEVQLAVARDDLACWNERILAERPILTLQRTESVTVERMLPNGPRVRHTVVASPADDGILFRSRLVNLGSRPARLTSLCYPSATAPVLKHLISVGPTCYGSYRELAPGDSVTAVTGGPLRGRPGRYTFQVHVVDPPLLDVTFRLNVVEVHDSR